MLDVTARPAGIAPDAKPVLQVEDLHVEVGAVEIVRGISYDLYRDETLVMIGESGSGKTISAEAVAGIMPSPPGKVTKGSVISEGVDLLALKPAARRAFSGRHLAFVPQDALASLNPTFSVGWQIAELHHYHLGLSKAEGRRRAIQLLDRVGIPAAARRVDEYPHEFSGGMRQRVMIAMAIALDPKIVIADEPTTALDVTVQAQILELLIDLQKDTGMSLMLITHDLGIAAEIADRIAVMYAGRIVELGRSGDIIEHPKHPYTYGLLKSFPDIAVKTDKLASIPGTPPNPLHLPKGCSFGPRCAFAQDRCAHEPPPSREVGSFHVSACHFAEMVPPTLETERV